MKTITKRHNLLLAILLFSGYASIGQKATATNNSKTVNATEMKTYVIEREIPGAGKLTAAQLRVSLKPPAASSKKWGHAFNGSEAM